MGVVIVERVIRLSDFRIVFMCCFISIFRLFNVYYVNCCLLGDLLCF